MTIFLKTVFLVMSSALLIGCSSSRENLSLPEVTVSGDKATVDGVLSTLMGMKKTPLPKGASMGDIERIIRDKFPGFLFKEVQRSGNILFFCFDVGRPQVFDVGSQANVLNSVVVDLDEMSYGVFCMAKS